MSINTVLFDLDGTVVDTNELITRSFEYTFEQYGLTFSKEEILSFNGPPLIDTFTKIDPNKAMEMMETYREHNTKYHDKYLTVYPNVKETLEALRARGKKLGIVTAKIRSGAIHSLETARLKSYFDIIVAVDDVTHSKPHPEPVIKAMNELGGVPRSTIMIGDNYHDIEAGKNAGVYTAGVAWSIKGRDFLESLNPTYMIEDMKDILTIVGE